MDGSCRIVLGDKGQTMTALPDEMNVVDPKEDTKGQNYGWCATWYHWVPIIFSLRRGYRKGCSHTTE